MRSKKNPKIDRVKSEKVVKLLKQKKENKVFFSDYMLSANNPQSIRTRRLQEMLEEKEEKERPEEFVFKARPYSKSKSEEKYQLFMNDL